MQHNKPIHIVLTIYTALCGLHETAYAGLTEKQHNITTTRVFMNTIHAASCGDSAKTA